MTAETNTRRQCDLPMPVGGNTTTPLAEGPEAASLNRRHSPEHILVVDDDVTVREALGEVLALQGYRVHLAGDGREAVRQFLDRPPDLILLDVNMPDITGWQTFEILAQFYPAVPVTIITARPGQVNRAADFGANAFLEKPLDIPELLRIVRALLDHPDSRHFPQDLRVKPTNDLLGTQG
jgi:DNA-binding response OmpR family regulator